MLKNKILYGLLILFVGIAMSTNLATAQVTEEEGYQSQTATSFSGIVVDASTGQPLSDVTVRVKEQDLEATTDQDGKFTFDNLDLDMQAEETEEGMGNLGITIEISHEGYQEFSQTISPDDIRNQSQGNMGDPEDPMAQSDENLMTFELEPKASS